MQVKSREPEYKPVEIVLETKEEFDAMWHSLNNHAASGNAEYLNRYSKRWKIGSKHKEFHKLCSDMFHLLDNHLNKEKMECDYIG